MNWLTDPQTEIAFVTFAALELVLGIETVSFISTLSGKRPDTLQKSAHTLPDTSGS